MSRRLTFFATCAPGLERLLHDEVRALGFGKIERQVGGVRFTGDRQTMWAANLWLRTAVRVLWRLRQFEATDGDALYREVQEVDWSRFVTPEGSLVVDAQTNQSELSHTQFLAQRVKDAIVDQFRSRHGVRPDVDRDNPDLRVHLHLFRNRATLSVDTSGASLHKRGWRCYQGYAPIAETLAAGLVLMSGWNRKAPMLDPFCGSGTLLIEAAWIAANIAPGSLRSFGFERWPGHDAAGWDRMRESARDERRPIGKVRLLGTELRQEHVEGAIENLAAADVEDAVSVERGDAREFAPRRGWNAWVLTNLPYGDRIGSREENDATLRAFGEQLRTHCDGYTLALLCGDPSDKQVLGFHSTKLIDLLNGGRPVHLLLRAGE